MIRNALLLVAALSIASPVLAKDAEKDEQANPDKKVCRYENSTGSIMRKRTCHTVAEWKQIEAANATATRQAMDRLNAARKLGGS